MRVGCILGLSCGKYCLNESRFLRSRFIWTRSGSTRFDPEILGLGTEPNFLTWSPATLLDDIALFFKKSRFFLTSVIGVGFYSTCIEDCFFEDEKVNFMTSAELCALFTNFLSIFFMVLSNWCF
jgi:hypothetical protein